MEKVQQTVKKLNKGQIASVYVLQGTEQYFIEQAKKAIQHALQNRVNDDVVTIDLLETSIQEVIMDAETIPFFNEHRLLFVYHPYFLTSKVERTPVKHDVAVLENYLLHAAPFTTIVFIAPYDKLDARKKITKRMKSHAQFVDCAPIRANELQPFIKQMTDEYDMMLTEEVIAMLGAQFENNLFLLEKEIEKMAVFAGENKTVSTEEALQLMSQSLTGNGLQLVDAVFKKDMKTALTTYKNIRKLGEEPIALLALLGSQIRNLLHAKIYVEQGYPLQHIQSEMKAHPYVVKLAVERSRKFSSNQLEEMIHLLANTDEKMKRGELEQNIAFELLLYQLIHLK